MALFPSQGVRDLAILMQDGRLTLLRPYPTLSLYAIFLFLNASWLADPLGALSHSQSVGDLATLMPDYLLTFLRSYLTPSMYMIWLS